MKNLIYKDESFKVIGLCMEVYNYLGVGFLEAVYKDALEYEFKKANIIFKREKLYKVNYKDVTLAHKYYADFVIMDKIILEVKSSKDIAKEHIAQSINYLKVSGNRLALIVNFGELKLQYKRIVL